MASRKRQQHQERENHKYILAPHKFSHRSASPQTFPSGTVLSSSAPPEEEVAPLVPAWNVFKLRRNEHPTAQRTAALLQEQRMYNTLLSSTARINSGSMKEHCRKVSPALFTARASGRKAAPIARPPLLRTRQYPALQGRTRSLRTLRIQHLGLTSSHRRRG